MHKKTPHLDPFHRTGVPFVSRRSIGGAKPGVEQAAHGAAGSGMPMNVARIYASPAVQATDVSDPRYNQGKSDQVENIYLPAAETLTPKPRAGIAQVWNWIINGRLA